ncbi:MAG: hypothetical protein E7G65_02590 [Veillonella sp.]|uniref:hypothetical protein n=1 Tax=Veillonella sp. TaxID=1926307 RepID=UPI00290E7B00|nr:hypothetical protein [Veillonella sp.]MDU3823056.1 hypothetical protein [Veillonella sp.]
MEINNLEYRGQKIDLEHINECYKKYDMFPTPWGHMDLCYLTNRIEYLKEQTHVSPIVEVRPCLYEIIETMKAIKAYLEKE